MPLIAPGLLESDRLIVRLVAEPDLSALMEVQGDAAVAKFIPHPPWQSMDDARTWYQRRRELHDSGSALQFVIVAKVSGQAVGTILIFRFDEDSARAEIGYTLARAHWGTGMMREALSLLVEHAFSAMKLRRLEAEVDPRNQSSAGLLLRLGFVKEGLLRERWITKGEVTDVEVFGLLRHEWIKPG